MDVRESFVSSYEEEGILIRRGQRSLHLYFEPKTLRGTAQAGFSLFELGKKGEERKVFDLFGLS